MKQLGRNRIVFHNCQKLSIPRIDKKSGGFGSSFLPQKFKVSHGEPRDFGLDSGLRTSGFIAITFHECSFLAPAYNEFV